MNCNKLEVLCPEYWCFSGSYAEDQRPLQSPLLHVEILQHVSVMAAGVLQQLKEQPDVLTGLDRAEVKKLADRIGAPDCRYSLMCVVTKCNMVWLSHHLHFGGMWFFWRYVVQVGSGLLFLTKKHFIDFLMFF